MAELSLRALDEVINARKNLHGGEAGAPVKLADGAREGEALNRACVVLLSASLQSFVEDCFIECSNKAFGHVLADAELKNYRNTWNRWGNPNPDNIVNLFRRLGVDDIFDGLSWQKQNTLSLRKNLNTINQIRNDIAHGAVALNVDGSEYSLRLSLISRWRNVAYQFGERFDTHALREIR